MRNCPATKPHSTLNGSVAHSPCNTAGKGQQYPAHHAGEASANHAQQDGGLERQIAGRETSGSEADPDAESQRNADPQDQIDLLLPGAFITKEQRLEFYRSHQGAGHRGSHAQLDQEIDEDESLFHGGSDLLGKCSMAGCHRERRESSRAILAGVEGSRWASNALRAVGSCAKTPKSSCEHI